MIAPWSSGKSVRGRRGSRQIVWWRIAAILIACALNFSSFGFGQQPVSQSGGSSAMPTVSGFSFGTRTSDGLSIFGAPTTTMPDGSLAILPVNSEDPNFPMGEGNYLPSPNPLTLQIPAPGNYSVAMAPDTNGILNYFELYTSNDGSNTVYSTAYTLDDSGNQIVLAQAALTPAPGVATAGAAALAAGDKATKTYPDGSTVSVTVTISKSDGPPPTVTETLAYVFTSATGVIETWTIVYTFFPNNWTGEVTVNLPGGGTKMLLLIGFYDGRPTQRYIAQ